MCRAALRVVLVAELLELPQAAFSFRIVRCSLPSETRDVLVAEEGRLAALPPVHAHRPLVAVEFLALELVAHRLELDPAALVLLVGQRVGIGDVLGRLAQRAGPVPNLRWPFVDGSIVCKCGRAKKKDEGCQSERSHASHYFATFFGLGDAPPGTHLAGNARPQLRQVEQQDLAVRLGVGPYIMMQSDDGRKW